MAGWFSWGRPDIRQLATTFDAVLDVLDDWRGSGQAETLLLRSCFERAWQSMDLGAMEERFWDRLADFAILFAANASQFKSVEINLLVSLNAALGKRALTPEEIETIISMNMERWQPGGKSWRRREELEHAQQKADDLERAAGSEDRRRKERERTEALKRKWGRI